MKTNFFTSIAPLLDKGVCININLMKADDKLVIAFKPGTTNLEDQSLNKLTPIMLTHPAEALDESFFETIQSPVQLVANEAEKIKSFEDQVKEAAEKSKAKKDADSLKTKEQKEEEKNKEKASGILKEADANFNSNNFNDALQKYQKAYVLCPEDENIKKSIDKTKDMMIVPIIEKATALHKANSYKECITLVKKARDLNPIHSQLKELETSISEVIGETVFNQLIQNK